MGEFKVIIVGAGPVGLVLAHALQASGIDYVIVERRGQVAPERAFGLFLWPQIIRIFHQLGLLHAIKEIGQPMNETIYMSIKGQILRRSPNVGNLEALYGYPMMLFNRGSFAKMLLEALQDGEQRLRTNKRVTNIVSHKEGVSVKFADGTSEFGSIVIGADGVWSTVRDQMKSQAPEGLFDQNPNPFEARYAGVFGKSNYTEGLAPGNNINVYYRDNHVQVFTSKGETHLIAYQRIPTSRERTHFEPNNAEDAAKAWLDCPVAEGLTFGDLWKRKTAGGSANFDEGVLEWWHWDRMVLVGDAAHKMNPVRGAGACCGIEDSIALVNALKRILRSTPNPSEKDLRQAFLLYQHERQSAANLWMDISRFHLDVSTGPSQPALKASNIADFRTVPLVVDAPILNDVAFPDEKRGFMKWRRRPKSQPALNDVMPRL